MSDRFTKKSDRFHMVSSFYLCQTPQRNTRRDKAFVTEKAEFRVIFNTSWIN